jgi:hypothetical protein
MYVTCLRVTCVVLLNVRDQYINNFDTTKHARLTREHTRLIRVAHASCLTHLLTSSIFIDITKTTTSGPQTHGWFS